MLKLTKLAGYAALIGVGLITQVASATNIDRNFIGGSCTTQNPQGVLKGTFVCDDGGKTFFSQVADVYQNQFRVTHIFENKTQNGGSVISIVVEKK